MLSKGIFFVFFFFYANVSNSVFYCSLQDYLNCSVHYIDDGPYFENLLQLIEHYSRYCDGLSTKLRASITSGIIFLLYAYQLYVNMF